MKLPPLLIDISNRLKNYGFRAIVVGGSVRDHFLSLPIKDYDIEVYGIETIEELGEILSAYGSINLVGRSFGVLKLVYANEEYDFSLPRRDKKISQGHRGFAIDSDSSMSYSEASKRRDFTINAMGYDIEEQIFLDPYGGMSDIASGVLRHIDDETFVEDPLRIYRAVQFCARFGYRLHDTTATLCREMVDSGALDELPKERVYSEFTKLLLKSPKPSIGFDIMHKLGILSHFPELKALIGVPQSPKYHPEGDVWIHTLMSVDAMVELLGDDKRQNLKYMWGILCHDIGKPSTTTVDEDNHIRAIGHEESGVEIARSFMSRLTNEHNFVDEILPLVKYHMRPSQLYRSQAKSSAIRRLATKVNIEEIVTIARADFLGRDTIEAKTGRYIAGDWLIEQSRSLKVHNRPLENLLQGRDLISLGMKPSKEFGEVLDRVYELQIEGRISSYEDAIEFVKLHISEDS